MRNSDLALLVIGYLALSNRAMKGEKIPSFEGNIEFSGAPIVTGSLTTVVLALLVAAVFASAFATVKEWQERTSQFNHKSAATDDRSSELGAAFGPLFTNPVIYLLIFFFANWSSVAFGAFVVVKCWPEMLIFIEKVLS